MRLIAVTLLAAALSLSGCAPDDSGSPTAVDGVGTAGPFPSVSAAAGGGPEFTFPEDGPAPDLQRQVLTEGDGGAVEAGDLLVADYLGQVWDGEVFDGSFDGVPAAFTIGTGAVIAGWDAGLVGQTVGSRVLLSIPPSLGYGEAGNPAAGIEGTDTIAFVVDILGSYGPGDAGEASAAPTGAATGPTVTGALGTAAAVTVPEGTPPPTEPRTTVIATGTGQSVVPGGIVVQYGVSTWDNSSTGSTWDSTGPEAVSIGGGGEFDALVGIPVGSRVLIELPGVEGGQPMAAVVDIVDQFDG